MKTLIALLLACTFTGCATTYTRIDAAEGFPGYTMRTYAFGNAEMAKSAQNFTGKLIVILPDGKSVTVDMTNGQSAEGLTATGLEAIVKATIQGIVSSFLPVAPVLP